MSNIIKKITSINQPFGETAARKDELKQAADSYKQVLDSKITDLKQDATRIGKQALIIGGVITAVYLLLELILPDDEEEQESNASIIATKKTESSWVGKAVQSIVISAALALAKQKLEEFLATQIQTNATENTDTTSEP